MAFVRGSAVTFSSLAYACPFRPTQRARGKITPALRTRTPATNAGAMVVGVGAFSSRLHGFKLIPSKWRYLVSPTSTPQGHNANRWAVSRKNYRFR
jgi:hypothetical protein